MNKLKKSILLACTFMCIASIAFAQCPDGEVPSCASFPASAPQPCDPTELGIVFTEDFDGSNTTSPPVFTAECYQSSRDYFGILCSAGFGCANEVNADYVYNGATGQYLAVRDTDGVNDILFEVCDAFQGGEFVTFPNIDISSCGLPAVMTLCFSIATSENMGGDQGAEWLNSGGEDNWDKDTAVKIAVEIDGGGFLPVTAAEAFENSNTIPGIDLNCSGSANGNGEPVLTNTFTQYCFELPSLGSTLDLRFEFIEFDGGGEDVAIDNITIRCPEDSSCIPFGVGYPSCTPFTFDNPGELWLEDFDGSNTTNPPDFTFSCYDGTRDYFGIVCSAGCAQEMNDDFTYFGSAGQFLGVRDMNGGACDGDIVESEDGGEGETVSFNGIDITGCTSDVLYLCFRIVESQNQGGASGAEWAASSGPSGRPDTWDGSTQLLISAEIDGAGCLPVTAVEAQVGSDSRPGFDLDCDGSSGDPGEVNLTDTFTEYCFNLPNLGASLDIKFNFFTFNTGGEDVGIDNISVQCGAPANVTVLPGKTPFTP